MFSFWDFLIYFNYYCTIHLLLPFKSLYSLFMFSYGSENNLAPQYWVRQNYAVTLYIVYSALLSGSIFHALETSFFLLWVQIM